jgi:tetratricopeptide (TPR) repeat protein
MDKVLLAVLSALLLSSCFGKDSKDYYLAGQEQYMEENYDSAIANMNKAIFLKSDFAKAYFERGEAYYNLKNYPKALADYSSAIQYNTVYAAAYRLRGTVKIAMGDTLGAFNDWQNALNLGDERANHYLRKYKKIRPIN